MPPLGRPGMLVIYSEWAGASCHVGDVYVLSVMQKQTFLSLEINTQDVGGMAGRDEI